MQREIASIQIQSALEGTRFRINLFLELQNRVQERFRAGGTPWNVYIHWNNLITTLHDGVIIEDAAGSGARAHGYDPLGLGHLFVEAANDGGNFWREAPGDDHQVGLTRGRTENFGAETSHVEARGGHGHHFDGAASQAETERPDGASAGPVHGFVELGKDYAFVFKQLAKIVGLSECYALTESYAHGSSSKPFSHIYVNGHKLPLSVGFHA